MVDDEERVCEALAFQLSTAGLQVMCFRSAQELLAADLTEFDCILADIFLPEINGLQLQEQLIAVRNFASIVFITGRGDLTIGVQAMRRGAVDVLEKPVGDRELLAAVTRAVERSRAERAQYARHAELEKRFRSLPARQRQVFTLITAGLLNKQVAAELGITERTVKVHRERLRRNMGANSLAELSRMAEILRITPPQTSSARTGVGSALERGL
ncbi:MAG: response regulator transcription factor [Deltaproteobacteria bacterium]|nr:response regulator transcription factor [Deltaproteobacteria bacterium]